MKKSVSVNPPLYRLDLVVHRAWKTDVMNASSFQVYHTWCFRLEDQDRASMEQGETVLSIKEHTSSRLRFGRVEQLAMKARCDGCGSPIVCYGSLVPSTCLTDRWPTYSTRNQADCQQDAVTFTEVLVKEEALATLPAEVARFIRSRARGMESTYRYCHIVLIVCLDEFYVLRGTGDVQIYGPSSFILRVAGSSIFFVPSGEQAVTHRDEESIWILGDWRDRVEVGTGQTLLHLSELGSQNQEMIFVCQVKVTRSPSIGEKGKDEEATSWE